MDSFPNAHVSPQRLMPADALSRLNEVTNELLELAKASRANKVQLDPEWPWVILWVAPARARLQRV